MSEMMSKEEVDRYEYAIHVLSRVRDSGVEDLRPAIEKEIAEHQHMLDTKGSGEHGKPAADLGK